MKFASEILWKNEVGARTTSSIPYNSIANKYYANAAKQQFAMKHTITA